MFAALALLSPALQDPIRLTPGTPFQGALHRLAHARQDFELEVPEGQVFLALSAKSAGPDIDLFGGPGDAPLSLEDAPLASLSSIGVERIVADRLSEPPLAPGLWWFSVATPIWDPLSPHENSRPNVPYTLEVVLLAPRTDAVLSPGPARSFALDPESGGFRTFRIDVPKDASLRVDLHGVPANLDLFARRGSPMTGLETALAKARHDWGAETLLLTPTSRPSVQEGPWFIDVMDAYSASVSTPFEIRVSFDPAPPAEWSVPPRLVPRAPEKPLARALVSVLEVFSENGGGSATLIAPDGLALTNAHVVDKGDRTPVDSVVLAANLDPRRPPEECFRATVVRFDADLDLALIQVDRGFYGTPLPADYRFPSVELAREDQLDIGDPLWIVGYPSLGGTGSRVSIHCARGILSGFAREEEGVLLKTDAAVIPGNSGGAALDQQGRLVGVPSANVADENGSVGLITPLSLLPAEWRLEIDKRAKR